MTVFAIGESKPWHCGQIARRMRLANREAVAAFGANSHAELRTLYTMSHFVRAWFIDGRLAALGGVTGSPIHLAGFVWLVLSEAATRHPVAVLREGRRQLGVILAMVPELETTIVPGDPGALRFAQWLGFEPVGERHVANGHVLLCVHRGAA